MSSIALSLGITRRSPTFAVGAAIVLLLLLTAIFANFIAPYAPTQAFPYEVLKPPSGKFLLGTDGNGMDVLSRVIHGTRYAFGIAVPAGIIMVLIGVPLGVIAGYKGGMIDE